MSYIVNWTKKTKAKAIEILTEYLSEYGTGESIMQGDNAIIDAPEVLSEIADLEGLVKYDEGEEDAV